MCVHVQTHVKTNPKRKIQNEFELGTRTLHIRVTIDLVPIGHQAAIPTRTKRTQNTSTRQTNPTRKRHRRQTTRRARMDMALPHAHPRNQPVVTSAAPAVTNSKKQQKILRNNISKSIPNLNHRFFFACVRLLYMKLRQNEASPGGALAPQTTPNQQKKWKTAKSTKNNQKPQEHRTTKNHRPPT